MAEVDARFHYTASYRFYQSENRLLHLGARNLGSHYSGRGYWR